MCLMEKLNKTSFSCRYFLCILYRCHILHNPYTQTINLLVYCSITFANNSKDQTAPYSKIKRFNILTFMVWKKRQKSPLRYCLLMGRKLLNQCRCFKSSGLEPLTRFYSCFCSTEARSFNRKKNR